MDEMIELIESPDGKFSANVAVRHPKSGLACVVFATAYFDTRQDALNAGRALYQAKTEKFKHSPP